MTCSEATSASNLTFIVASDSDLEGRSRLRILQQLRFIFSSFPYFLRVRIW